MLQMNFPSRQKLLLKKPIEIVAQKLLGIGI